jgi:hypothetical protein
MTGMPKSYDDVQKRLLTFVQSLNGIAMAMLGGVAIVYQTFPDVVRSLLSKLPPTAAALALFVFGTAVHLALRQAKKAGQ